MTRISLALLALLTLCALGLVTSQHEARKLVTQLNQEQERARQLDIEYGQLQLEASTWAMHARIERIARTSLRMQPPAAGRVQLVDASAALSAPAGRAATTAANPAPAAPATAGAGQ